MAKKPTPKSDEVPKRVLFTYEEAADYRVYSANGVVGGTMPRGDVLMQFFLESQPVPQAVQQNINPDGTLAAVEVTTSNVPTFRRRIVAGVVMSQGQARALGEWLLRLTRDASGDLVVSDQAESDSDGNHQ